tara:strand:- start:12988 stop:14250 length:1263 start_codon:yes stop_codon:yes gene_type:complete
MELTKTKYKQTEVGLIPEDWNIVNIGSQCQIFGRIGFRGYTVNDIVKEDQGAITLSPSNIVNGQLNLTKLTYLSWFKYEESPEIKIFDGDILLVKTGSTYGKTALVKNLKQKATLNPQVIVLKKTKCNNIFLGYLMAYPIVKNQIESSVVGGAIPTLSQEQVSRFIIPLPPTLLEQKAIATALSDVDELISNLDQLITKKKAIKQGAMQQLLTPDENWVKTSLIELAENKKNQFDDGDWIESEHIISQGVRLIQTGNIGVGVFKYKENKKYISDESFNKLNCKEVLKGDLLICRLAEPAGRACVMPNIGEDKVVTSVDVSIFRGNPLMVNREFLSQIFTTNGWFQKVIEKVGGTTHKRISRGALGKISIEVPIIEEQLRISLVLTDMDKEIEQLESKKAKYQDIKQGMMQELLAGKTRLV